MSVRDTGSPPFEMSVARDILRQAWPQDDAVFGEVLMLATGDRSGGLFRGVLMPTELIDPDLPLGRDPREAAMLEIARDAEFTMEPYGPVVAFIEMEDRIRQGGYSWTVIHREDNPADHVVKFTCVKVVAGLDT